MKKYALIIIIPLIILAAASCKKHNGPAPGNPATDSALISNVRYFASSGFLTTYRITYNADHTVDSIIGTQYNTPMTLATVTARKFYYFSDHYFIVATYEFDHPSSDTVNSVFLNSNGSVKTIVNKTATFNFSYSNGRVASMHDSIDGWYDGLGNYFPPTTVNYVYHLNNYGNIDSVITLPAGTDNQHYSYDLTKFGQTGDMLRISQFLTYGRAYATAENVPVSQYYANPNPFVPNIFYEFDSAGRILKTYTPPTVSGGYGYDSVSYSYSYY